MEQQKTGQQKTERYSIPTDTQPLNNTQASEYSVFNLEQLREQMTGVENRRKSNGNTAFSDYGKHYLKFLNQPQKAVDSVDAIKERIRRGESRPNKAIVQKMSFGDAKEILWEIIKIKLERENRVFEANEGEKVIINNLVKYFIGDKSCKWDLNKCLFIYGNTGCGKTFMMECFKTFCENTNTRNPFKQKKPKDIHTEIALTKGSRTDSPQKVMLRYKKRDFFFDDLGDELIFYNDYGNKVDYMIDILTDREEAFTKGTLTTHITSNMIPFPYVDKNGDKVDEINDRYGSRIKSRFDKMFNYIYWEGRDKRKDKCQK
jgi:energy-coupling factor transporter ATP-binding protein EcfA2